MSSHHIKLCDCNPIESIFELLVDSWRTESISVFWNNMADQNGGINLNAGDEFFASSHISISPIAYICLNKCRKLRLASSFSE